MKLILALATLIVFQQVAVADDTRIVFKRVNTYQWIYDDSGTGANEDLSIYRPTSTEYGYYAVGDVAVACHCQPQVSAIMVKEVVAGSVAKPLSFTEVWNDRGSGGRHDVRIMRMNPPSGYTCVGHVAILGYGSNPDKNKYRCIKDSYVTRGKYELIWLDRGSGASRDAGLWGNRVSEHNTNALDANAFTSFATHATPSGSPSMMNGQYVINHQIAKTVPKDYIFTVYETTDLDEIWNDRGSGASNDIAVWRSRGIADAYSLGDIAVRGGKPSNGFVVKAQKQNALSAPYDFRKVWDDRGSGADWDGAFWLPLCPPHYRPIGHIATRNHGPKPLTRDIRCVASKYTIPGRWEWVWNDGGSGADDDVSVWKAVRNGKGQGVQAMSSIRHHGNMNVGAYVLNPDQVNYVKGKPATKYILTNVRYLFDDRKIIGTEPESLERTILENRGDTVQESTREIGYSYEESYSWGNTVGLEVGVTTTFEGGVPLVAKSETSISVTASYSHEWGGSETKTKEDKIHVNTKVQPHSQKSAIVSGNRYTADVPYVATLTTEYADGTTSVRQNFKGVYHGVQVNEIRVIYEADIPL